MYKLRTSKYEGPSSLAAPGGKRLIEAVVALGVLVACTLLAVSRPVHAAPLNLGPTFFDPHVTTNNAGITYDYTGGGSGGVLTITGLGGATSVQQDVILPNYNGNGGLYQIVSNPAGGSPGGVGPEPLPGGDVTPVNLNSEYILTAYFDDAGNFSQTNIANPLQKSNVQIYGYVDNTSTLFEVLFGQTYDPHPDMAATGTLLTADLYDFGFTGGPTTGGVDTVTLEWHISPTGGDLATAYNIGPSISDNKGVVASGNVDWGVGGSFGGDWDPSLTNSGLPFQSDFASCAGCALELNTFLPVPPAAWLLATGLAGLLCAGTRRKRRGGDTAAS